MAKLTTIGMYQYDDHLFDGLTFPAGIDKDIAISQILTRSGEFEVLYPNPTFYAQMITFWGKKHYRTFEKWVEGLAEPFNPLYNYDRYEEYTDTKSGSENVKNTSSAGTATSGARNTETGDTSEKKRSAFDSSVYTPEEYIENGGSVKDNTLTNSQSTGDSQTDTGRNELMQHNAHLYGNIGVTTSAQMLKEFLEVERWNIYEQIADLFIDEFCIMVY